MRPKRSSSRGSFPGVAARGISGVVTLAVLVACVVLSSCGGSSSSPGGTVGTTSSPGPPPVGKPIRMSAGPTTLVVTPRRVIFPLRGSGMLLSPGDAAAGVEVAVHNVGHGVYDSSSESDVGLRTTSGASASPGFASQGVCTTTEIDFLKEVQPGESRSGCVAFDLPKGAKPAAVTFSPRVGGTTGRTWVVKG
jgi:uncharacterized protein DUF4352